jgi:hypothetical protein
MYQLATTDTACKQIATNLDGVMIWNFQSTQVAMMEIRWWWMEMSVFGSDVLTAMPI